MAYAIDDILVDLSSELSGIAAHAHLSGADPTLSRIRDHLDDAAAEINALRTPAPVASASVRGAVASLSISIGYLWAALREREADSSSVGLMTLKNHLWTSTSYVHAGTALLVAAIRDAPTEGQLAV